MNKEDEVWEVPNKWEEQCKEWSDYKPTLGDNIVSWIEGLIEMFLDMLPLILGALVILFMIWGLAYGIFVNEKEVDGHTYIRMSIYDWDHSPECRCKHE